MPDSIELYLIRHAIAEERGDKWPDDAKRPLTLEGTARMRKAAKGLVRLGVKFDVVLTSPLVRARQRPGERDRDRALAAVAGRRGRGPFPG
jgi:phosphohistidine phosphatase